MNEKIRRIRKNTICLALAGIIVLSFFMTCFFITAYADTIEAPTEYTISADFDGTDFSMTDFPKDPEDNLLDVFQVAETVNGEVYIYVYNPSCSITATRIRMSREPDYEGKNITAQWHDYTLVACGSEETITRYRVVGLTVNSMPLRYYNIAAIFRKYNSILDGTPSDGSTVTETAVSVGRIWTVCTLDGNVYYNMTRTKVVNITASLCGFISCENGFSWNNYSQTDSHFIAFSTDIDMYQIVEADMTFCTQHWEYRVVNQSFTYGEISEPISVTLYYDDIVTNDKGVFGRAYQWQRISTKDEFVSNMHIGTELQSKLAGLDWVFQFYETELSVPGWGGWSLLGKLTLPGALISLLTDKVEGEYVSSESIQRIAFTLNEDGPVYNMGVVDDVRTPGTKPSQPSEGLDIPVWVYFAAIALVVLVVLVLLAVFAPQVLPPLFHGIGVVVTAPFKLMSAAVNSAKKANAARKERKEDREAEKEREEARKERRERKRQREREKLEREREVDHE